MMAAQKYRQVVPYKLKRGKNDAQEFSVVCVTAYWPRGCINHGCRGAASSEFRKRTELDEQHDHYEKNEAGTSGSVEDSAGSRRRQWQGVGQHLDEGLSS